jgi:hypothetical protein
MIRKTRTLSCRSPVRTRPPLLPGSRAPDAAGGSHGADGPTQPAPPPVAHHRGGQHPVLLGAPNSRSLAPLARTRVTAPPAFVLIAPVRPSGAEIPAVWRVTLRHPSTSSSSGKVSTKPGQLQRSRSWQRGRRPRMPRGSAVPPGRGLSHADEEAAEQAAWERSAAELRARLAARERTEARRLAEARRPPTLGEVIYGRGQQYDGKAARLRSIAGGFAKGSRRR